MGSHHGQSEAVVGMEEMDLVLVAGTASISVRSGCVMRHRDFGAVRKGARAESRCHGAT